jgi:hypothetical protein
MQAAQIGASGVIIANSEDLHFAAPPDDSLRADPSGASASLLAVMVSRSTGNRLAEVYDESKRSNLNPQVRLCSGIRAEAQKQNEVKRALTVLYKGLPRLDSATSLLDLEKQRHQMEVTARARLNAPDWVRWFSDWVRWLSDWVRWLSDSLLVPAARFSAPPRHPASPSPPRHPAIPSRSASKRAKQSWLVICRRPVVCSRTCPRSWDGVAGFHGARSG